MAVPFANVGNHARGSVGGVFDRFGQAGDAAFEGAGTGFAIGGRRQARDDHDSIDVEIVIAQQHAAGFVGKFLPAQVS